MGEGKRDGLERCHSCGKPGPAIDSRLATALSHPLRAKALALLNEAPAAPSELAEKMGEDVNNVSYHVRVLADLGLAEVVKREQGKRATMKTIYRGTTRMLLDDDVWPTLTKETRTGISIKIVEETIERARAGLEAGTFDSKGDRHAFNWKLDLDEQGWTELAEAGVDYFERVKQIEVDAANRGTPKFRATASLLSYESP